MQMNKTDQNDAEGLAQIMRMGVAGQKVPPAQQVERPAEGGIGLCT